MSSALLASAVYEGTVRHSRHVPRPHAFQYRMAQLYLDLDEVDQVFDGHWLWSSKRRNIGEFRRSDYLGAAELPLAEAVRRRVAAATGQRPEGAIRLLTHLRYFGYVFNPVSFYYCHRSDGELTCIVAEITNTPWSERHAYVLAVEDARPRRPFAALVFRESVSRLAVHGHGARLRLAVHATRGRPARPHASSARRC